MATIASDNDEIYPSNSYYNNHAPVETPTNLRNSNEAVDASALSFIEKDIQSSDDFYVQEEVG